jgi:hypothetical protein
VTLTVAEAAVRYATAGMPVFPCDKEKSPLTENGYLNATTHIPQVRRWWARWENALIAIPTGRVSKLLVLDVDGDEGRDALHDLERRHEPLPVTANATTPGGGEHFYFRYPAVEVRCSVSKLALHINVRGDGGYAIVPPSRLPDGRQYEFDRRGTVAPLPAWLLELLTAAGRTGQSATDPSEWARMVRDGIDEGERNNQFARLAGHLLRKDLDSDLVLELLLLVNARCRPEPLPADEVGRIVTSIAGTEARRRQRRATWGLSPTSRTRRSPRSPPAAKSHTSITAHESSSRSRT